MGTRLIGSAVVVALLGAALSAGAQQPARIARVGVLLFGSPEGDPNLRAFRQGLAQLGHVEGKTIALTYRYAAGRPERLPELARELASLRPDVLFVLGGDVAPAARAATSEIPIVMAVSNDPVAAGLVPSLARPGGNLTGVTFASSDLAAKRLQFLKEAAPKVVRVGVLWNPEHVDPGFEEVRMAARALGHEIQSLEVRRPEEFEGAFRAATAGRVEAIMVVPSRLLLAHRQRVLEFAASRRVPLMTGWGPWAQDGALLSYGPDLDVMVRRAAAQVDRLLKGARPGDIAVERPTKFDLVINLRTAAALGLTIPPSLRLQATQLIE